MTVLGERMVSWGGGIAAFLEEGILVSQPSPLGEGAPQGRIGQTWNERQLVVQGKRGAFVLHTKAPYPPLTRSPFPMRGRLVWRRLRRLFLLERCPKAAF